MSQSTHEGAHIPVASDIMVRELVTLSEDTPILEAMDVLLKHNISGAPVLDPNGALVGMCSEYDCLRVLAAGQFYSDDHSQEGVVRDYMTKSFRTANASDDIYAIAQGFLQKKVRRLPILQDGALVGQISRRDVLKAMAAWAKQRAPSRHYPDYREPGDEVASRRH